MPGRRGEGPLSYEKPLPWWNVQGFALKRFHIQMLTDVLRTFRYYFYI